MEDTSGMRRSKNELRSPAANVTAYRCASFSTPASAAIGIVASSIAWPRSVAIRIGRRRSRSTHTPTNSTVRIPAPMPAERSSAIWNGAASSVRIAANGIATPLISDPKSETVSPLQSFRKSRLRHSRADRGCESDIGGLRRSWLSVKRVAFVADRAQDDDEAVLSPVAGSACARRSSGRAASKRLRHAVMGSHAPLRNIFPPCAPWHVVAAFRVQRIVDPAVAP